MADIQTKIDKWAGREKVNKICSIINDRRILNFVRIYAVEKLAAIKKDTAAEGLLTCLGGELFKKQVDFRDNLKPEEIQLFKALIKGLGNFPDKKVVLSLLKIIYFNRSYYLLDETAEALLKISDAPFTIFSADYVRNDRQGREGAAKFLCRVVAKNTYYMDGVKELRLNYKIEEKDIQALLMALEDEDGNSGYKEAIIEILGSMKEKRALPYILRFLGKAENKKVLVEAIGSLADQSAVKELIELFAAEEDIYLRKEIVNTFGKIKSVEAVNFLLDCMRCKDYKSEAISALGIIKSKKALPALAELAKDNSEDAWNRSIAIEALGRMKAKEHTGLIISLLENKGLRCACVKALGELGGPEALESLAALFVKTEKEYFHDTHKELISSLSLFYGHVHLLAAKALGGLKDPSVLPILREALPEETDLVYVGGYPFDSACKCKIVSEAIKKIAGSFERPELYYKAVHLLKESGLR